MKFTHLFAKGFRKFIFRHQDASKKIIRENLRKIFIENEILTMTKENFSMYVSPHDYVSHEIFFYGVYDQYMTFFIKSHLFEGDYCWDIGTERGWFTLLFASIVGKTGHVDSFEAYPPNFEKLKRNIEINQFQNVHINNFAISDSSGSQFFVPPSNEITHNVNYLNDNGGVGYISRKQQETSILVRTITIDQYVEENHIQHIDLIKIDIEGEEYAALKGGKETIERFRPLLLVEYNREALFRGGSSIEKLDNLLDDYGYDRYTFFKILEKIDLKKFSGLPDNQVVFNVYCFPRGTK